MTPEDRALYKEVRLFLFRSEWFPYRVYEFVPRNERDDFENCFGPCFWMAPKRGPFSTRPFRRLLKWMSDRGWS